ncbi:MAG: ACP phosphodiesterase [Chitinophagaceae bacterium]|nr:ACP phosphodiesterase [Chitinophagaceae bacterium]
MCLAHAYLSPGGAEVLTGNMISDFVKGRTQYDYPAGIRHGIRLHRSIDRFTDEHAATREAKQVFRPAYRLYAGAFVDVVYDHFLANDRQHFSSDEALYAFTRQAYAALSSQQAWLPPRFALMLQPMQQHNWLYNYQYAWGIEKSFGGLVHRSRYLTESATAFQLFQQHYALLQQCYHAFMPALYQLVLELAAEQKP